MKLLEMILISQNFEIIYPNINIYWIKKMDVLERSMKI